MDKKIYTYNISFETGSIKRTVIHDIVETKNYLEGWSNIEDDDKKYSVGVHKDDFNKYKVSAYSVYFSSYQDDIDFCKIKELFENYIDQKVNDIKIGYNNFCKLINMEEAKNGKNN